MHPKVSNNLNFEIFANQETSHKMLFTDLFSYLYGTIYWLLKQQTELEVCREARLQKPGVSQESYNDRTSLPLIVAGMLYLHLEESSGWQKWWKQGSFSNLENVHVKQM